MIVRSHHDLPIIANLTLAVPQMDGDCKTCSKSLLLSSRIFWSADPKFLKASTTSSLSISIRQTINSEIK